MAEVRVEVAWADLEVVRGVVGRRGVQAAGLGRHHVRKEGVGLRAVHSHLYIYREAVQIDS